MQAKQNGSMPKKSSLAKRSALLLGALLLLLVIVVWRTFRSSSPEPVPVTHTAQTETKNSRGFDPLKSADPNLSMPELRAEMPIDDGGKRNLFDYYVPPPPPPPPQPIRKVEETAPQVAQAICGNRNCEAGENYVNCPTDCPPPPPPPINTNLKYIGYLSEDGGPVAFLTDGKEVFMGKVNDIIANKFRILSITDQGVELGTLNREQTKTIPFEGNQS